MPLDSYGSTFLDLDIVTTHDTMGYYAAAYGIPVEGAPNSNGDRYQKILIANTRTIVEGLGGKSTPFQPQSKNIDPY